MNGRMTPASSAPSAKPSPLPKSEALIWKVLLAVKGSEAGMAYDDQVVPSSIDTQTLLGVRAQMRRLPVVVSMAERAVKSCGEPLTSEKGSVLPWRRKMPQGVVAKTDPSRLNATAVTATEPLV